MAEYRKWLKKSEAELKAKIGQTQHDVETAAATLSHTRELYEARLADAQATADKLVTVQASEAELVTERNSVYQRQICSELPLRHS